MSGFPYGAFTLGMFLSLVYLCYGLPTCRLGPPVYCTSQNASLHQERKCLGCDILKLNQMTTRLQLRTASAIKYNQKKGYVSGDTGCDSFTVITSLVRSRMTYNTTTWRALSTAKKLSVEFSFMEDFHKVFTRTNMAAYAVLTDVKARRNLELVKTDLLSLKSAASDAVKRAEQIQSKASGQQQAATTIATQAQSGQTTQNIQSAALVDCVLKELDTTTLRFKANLYYLQQNI